MRPLLAVDGDNLAHRAWHALPKVIKGADGHPGNAIIGFTNMLLFVWEAEKPRTVFVGFDSVGEPTYRNELLPQYQEGRDFPFELTNQLDRLPQLVEALGFAWAKGAGYEADDFLAAAVAAEEKSGGTALVLTTDRDLFQLASPKTTVLRPRRGVSEIDRIGPDQVREIYGVDPEQVPDFVALRGDPSDRIPGAPGVGPGRAAAILKAHGSLDAALQNGGFPTIADDLRTYLRMTRLQYEAPLPELPDAEPTWERGAELLESWGHGAAAKRLRERA
ncbi:MAG TPA: 5'-3' exonuclease [Gaiellaceae bacterium]|nr:5'-3' exonuclease [Gaiellaceae bacterium]